MSGAADVERVYSAMERAAGLLDLTCARQKILPILTAYQDALADSVIVFSMSGGDHSAELDFSFTVPSGDVDPYAFGPSTGIVAETDHPIASLLTDTGERCPVAMYGVDGEVSGGFKKTYAAFPINDLLDLSKLVAVPSMPSSVADNFDLFTRYGLDKVQGISIDYQRKQVNLYCGDIPAGSLEPETVRSMLREMGLREPSEEGLEFVRKSFAVYPTLSWDSSRIERICFAVISTDPTLAPTRVESDAALFSKYANNAPYAYAGERRTLIYGLAVSRTKEYIKLGSYYQISDHQRKLVKAFDALED
ncbi:aromatic prenyltransferase [Streptomyces sp. NPDC058595]|uniref:aromatic prenyltransferase n=1 Tax=Streptomyces sp. NPDC058595 TaxID=3346550 RepID=UPI0036468C85